MRPLSGDPPTKELPLHRAFYEGRSGTGAVVHLHSTFATLLSCLDDVDPADAVPSITPYVVMRVGRVPVLPYMPPGSADLTPLVYAAEELEETAKLAVLGRGLPLRTLDPAQIAVLEAASLEGETPCPASRQTSASCGRTVPCSTASMLPRRQASGPSNFTGPTTCRRRTCGHAAWPTASQFSGSTRPAATHAGLGWSAEGTR